MRRMLTLPIAIAGSALFLALAAPKTPAEPKAMTVRVGLVNTLFRDEPEKQIQSISGPFKSLLEEQAGIVGEVVSGGDYANLAAQLKDEKVHLGVFNGTEFAWAHAKYPDLKVLMVAVDRQPYARVVLVVRADDKAADAAALKGKNLALPLLAREHVRAFVERRVVAEGMTMDKWFAKVATPRTAQDALDDVAEKFSQAAAVDDVDFKAFQKAFPKTGARLRVLAESEKFPCAAIVYKQGVLKEETLTKLRAGMIESKSTERGRKLLDLCRITGFEKAPADYEQSLTDILKAYPPAK